MTVRRPSRLSAARAQQTRRRWFRPARPLAGPVALVVLAATMAIGTSVATAPPAGALAAGVVPLAAADSSACAINASGGAMCWGGSGNSTPTTLNGLSSGVAAIATGGSFHCVVTTSGGAKCLGSGANGRLGNGSTGNSTTPVDVTGLTSGVSRIAVGPTRACAVTTAGGAKCWGSGTLGNGTSSGSTTPVDVTGLTAGVVDIALGGSHTCALLATGGVKCWGSNASLQFGNGTFISSSTTPVDVTGLTGITAITARQGHTCGLTSGGGVTCWGSNDYGQLGNGSTAQTAVPVDVTGLSSGVDAISAGQYHTCAMTSTGGVRCWGLNDNGRLGSGSTRASSLPVDVLGVSNAVAIVAGATLGCALISDGRVQCWGSNQAGQLGTTVWSLSRTPIDVHGLASGATSVSLGTNHSCATTTTGGATCWGRQNDGQVGSGLGEYYDEITPRERLEHVPIGVTGLASGVGAVDAGDAHSCALTSTGEVRCWGQGAYGRLGNGAPSTRTTPVVVTGLAGATAVAGGGSHSCAITSAGGATCWGLNTSGQLGDTTTTNALTPVAVSGLASGVAALATGANHTCALSTVGAVWCWGLGTSGQLGNGANTSSSTPIAVPSLASDVTAIAAGGDETCAIAAGALRCWGLGTSGQLGNGASVSASAPVDVVGLASGVTGVSVGSVHACAVVSGGARCWGGNGSGRLGDGTVTTSSTPVDVTGLSSGVVAVGAGGSHSCALTTAGALKCWGSNDYGQLGMTPAREVIGGATFYREAPSGPTISGSRSPAANANGWNNEPVTVSFTCSSDALASCTPSQVVSTDGADQSVTGTATDTSGQTASTTVSGVSIDRVAPTIAGVATSPPNGAGWYNAPVTMAWTCDDALSGISAGVCPPNSTTVGEGSTVSVSQSVHDRAGNTTAGSSQSVQIDLTKPSTGVSSPPTWSRTDVSLTLSASDALSGVASTSYVIDGGATRSGIHPVVSGQGTHTVEYWSTDVAGNEESHASVTVNIDVSAPSISGKVSPVPNANGWNRGDVSVTFTCGDTGSGVASCSGDRSFTTEVDTTVTGTATDVAGNTASDQVPVRIDRSAPSVTAQVPPANSHGWFNAAVQVPFSCSDSGGSGIDVCPAPVMFAGEGADQAVSGVARDNAANSGTATGATVSVDVTAPVISGAATSGGNGDGGFYGTVNIHWTCSDALSGIVSCPADQVVSGEGVHTVSASVNDRAGNTSSAEVTVRIDHDPATDPGFVHGIITDAVSGLPVKGAVVGLARHPQQSTAYSVKTGTDGSYTIPIVADGTYKLYVNNNGAHLQAWFPNETRQVDAPVLAIGHGTNLTADQALTPGYVLRGRVTSSVTGAPISGANVRVQGGGVDYLATTDATGSYAVTGMVAGTRTVTFVAFGHAPVAVSASIPATSVMDRGLVATGSSSGVKGTITALTLGGAPLAGATVRVWPKNGFSIGITATTGSDGRYALSNLPVGDYEIDVVRGDYQVRWYADSLSRTGATTVALPAGCTATPDATWGDPCATPVDIRMIRP